jgi:hypothetical protein
MLNSEEILDEAATIVWRDAPRSIHMEDLEEFIERRRPHLLKMIEKALGNAPVLPPQERGFRIRDTYRGDTVTLPGSTVLLQPTDPVRVLGHRVVGDTFTWKGVGALEDIVDHDGLDTGHAFYYEVDGGHQRLVFTSEAHEVT